MTGHVYMYHTRGTSAQHAHVHAAAAVLTRQFTDLHTAHAQSVVTLTS